ncbi:antitoxin Xre/MbcA/ParS toxin-binding domain-containing protein [Sphingomonas sp. M1-B02]|uniref:antitoxin Xre/MbcA/ParS toxin-binding domain-containing protein n=1 Tax=Sphingomonas sp. M1-B02 TaxID=3114300 RepID=UPI0022407E5B|nr:antitoxin Xre/MbcA/ParS toxin-binding domain-containing protein [Sphingomonas sp. S6-11]UZK64693.1 MbcA/ParS/Xre antitoxin family protein [Sphingomonas sp. S6-11]
MNKPFRKRFDSVKLTKEEAERQGKAATLAWKAFPEPGAAVAFMNEHDDALGGRPIDLVVASEEGLRAVEQAIAARQA